MNLFKHISAVFALLLSLAFATSVQAAENPFGFQADEKAGTMMVAEGSKCGGDKEGKCGEGKCGGDKKAKCGEGKCGGDKKAKCGEGKCGGDKKGKCGEGKCGGDKKGKCGEGKCGSK